MRIAFKSFDRILPISLLKASRFQRNKHSKEQISRLAKIMREHGVRHPIHISKRSGQVCFGHGRWEAAKLNGWTKFPVVYQEFNSDEEEYSCVQSDNAIAEWSELDVDAIQTDVQEFGEDFDVDLLGIEGFGTESDNEESEEPSGVVPKTIFEVVVECDSEAEQERIYSELTKKGKRCRVLTM